MVDALIRPTPARDPCVVGSLKNVPISADQSRCFSQPVLQITHSHFRISQITHTLPNGLRINVYLDALQLVVQINFGLKPKFGLFDTLLLH